MDINKTLKKKYKWLAADDYWKVHNNWIVKHDAVMRIAAEEGVEFEDPHFHVSNENSSVAIYAGAKLGDKRVWTTGEASLLHNCKAPYPFAMAEKRFKDRATLMLIGVYHLGVYSDTEADDFEKSKKKVAQPVNGMMTPAQEAKIREMIGSHLIKSEERISAEGWLAKPQGHSKTAASDAIEKLSGMIKRRAEQESV